MKKLLTLFSALVFYSMAFGQASVTRSGLTVQQANLIFTTPVLGNASGASLRLSSLTSGRVPYATTAGLLTDNAAFTFNSGTGALSATSFVGSGAFLTAFPKADVLEASTFAADAGSNDTYVITLSPAITAYVTGVHYRFKANTANTGAATININGLGPKAIVKAAGGITTVLADNDIRAGQWVDLVYDGTNMQMQSLLGNASSGSVTSVAQSFTGGIISVGGSPVTGAGTLALTVAGTSGGVPYFSSASTWASSGILGLGNIIVGGGAGGTPTSTALSIAGNNMTVPGNVTMDVMTANSAVISDGSGVAGSIALTQGTAPTAGTTSWTLYPPTSVTSYKTVVPGATGTGLWLGTDSSGTETITRVTAIPSGYTAATQTAADNSTKIATTAYADRGVIINHAASALGSLTGTIDIDWSLSNNFYGTLTGNTTFTFSNATAGQFITVDVAQTGTNSYTVTWPSAKWSGGSAPVMTAGAATSDITTIWYVNSLYKGSSNQNVK